MPDKDIIYGDGADEVEYFTDENCHILELLMRDHRIRKQILANKKNIRTDQTIMNFILSYK